jgi:hypothetical protein
MAWTDALQLQIELEGGYVFSNDPDDPGGATYAGITLTELKQQAPDLAKSFPHLSQSDVGSYYYKWYWQTIKPLATHADLPEPVFCFKSRATWGQRRLSFCYSRRFWSNQTAISAPSAPVRWLTLKARS